MIGTLEELQVKNIAQLREINILLAEKENMKHRINILEKENHKLHSLQKNCISEEEHNRRIKKLVLVYEKKLGFENKMKKSFAIKEERIEKLEKFMNELVMKNNQLEARVGSGLGTDFQEEFLQQVRLEELR